MSKADKMFEELGYKKNDTTDKWGRIWGIDYQNPKKWTSIKIDFIDAEVCGGTLDDDSEPIFISMQELQAINIKCKELRMDINKQEHEFLDSLLIEVYKAKFTQEQLNKMTVDEKKDYIKQVSEVVR